MTTEAAEISLGDQELSDRRLFDAALRNDLSAFAQKSLRTIAPGVRYRHNWHVDALAHHLEEVLAGRITRLLVTMPPRHLKSTLASIALPAFALGRDPRMRIVCASANAEVAAAHHRDCETVMRSAWYGRLFPRTRFDPKRLQANELAIRRGGRRRAVSVSASHPCPSADLLIIDDPVTLDRGDDPAAHEAARSWFQHQVCMDACTQDGKVIVIASRHSHDDIAEALSNDAGWTHLSLAARARSDHAVKLSPHRVKDRATGNILHEDRMSYSDMVALVEQIGVIAFRARHQQAPLAANEEWAIVSQYEDDDPDEFSATLDPLENRYIVVMNYTTRAEAAARGLL